MEIRHLGPTDTAIHCEIAAAHKERTISIECAERFLSDDDNCLIAATLDDEVVGFALGYLMSRVDSDQPMMMLYEIDVREDHRRKGIGSALIKKMLEVCKARNVMKLFVGTGISNEPAKALYSSTGGKQMEGAGVGFEYTKF